MQMERVFIQEDTTLTQALMRLESTGGEPLFVLRDGVWWPR
ncbi:MAG: hypothetical protein VB049_10650 [Candidatus Pelethousia sp.]|nr:hypothetical protein [Candidatus Pelethousia sp.]